MKSSLSHVFAPPRLFTHANPSKDTRMADRTIQTLTPSSEVRVHSESDNVKIGATPLVARDHGPTTSMREDFAEAQRLRASLQSRLDETEDELERLKRRAGRDAVRLAELGAEKNSLLVRLRDRDEELKGKMKLVEVRSLSILTYKLALKLISGCTRRINILAFTTKHGRRTLC